MENTLYYTLSTIPQVVAAILALTGVFVVLRIEALHKRIMAFGQRILDQWRSLEQDGEPGSVYLAAFTGTKGLRRKERIRGAITSDAERYLIEQIKEIGDIETDLFTSGTLKEIPPRGFNKQVALANEVVTAKGKLVYRMKMLFVISGITILTPLFCLMFTSLIHQNVCLSIVILIINFTMVATAVLYTIWLIWNTIESKE